MDERRVHAEARDIIDFWFALPPEKHFAKDDALDREIAERFGVLRDQVLATEAIGWRDDPDTLLAAVPLPDPFSRNLQRGSAAAQAAGPIALARVLGVSDSGCQDR